MAVAHTRLDDGNRRLADAGLDEARAATRDEDVDKAVGMHELAGLGTIGRVDQAAGIRGKPGGNKALTTALDDRAARHARRAAALEDARVTRTGA